MYSLASYLQHEHHFTSSIAPFFCPSK
uniref:Uncharacterized protein n=1 Tax=Anguilla anguilla TaxID=7936 RepID=A0A0E9RQ95_ANGAN